MPESQNSHECRQQHGVGWPREKPNTGDGDDADQPPKRRCIGSDRFLQRIQGSEYTSTERSLILQYTPEIGNKTCCDEV